MLRELRPGSGEREASDVWWHELTTGSQPCHTLERRSGDWELSVSESDARSQLWLMMLASWHLQMSTSQRNYSWQSLLVSPVWWNVTRPLRALRLTTSIPGPVTIKLITATFLQLHVYSLKALLATIISSFAHTFIISPFSVCNEEGYNMFVIQIIKFLWRKSSASSSTIFKWIWLHHSEAVSPIHQGDDEKFLPVVRRSLEKIHLSGMQWPVAWAPESPHSALPGPGNRFSAHDQSLLGSHTVNMYVHPHIVNKLIQKSSVLLIRYQPRMLKMLNDSNW